MKRTGTKRIICLIVAIAAVFAMLPWGAVSIVASASNNAPWFMDGLHSFAITGQGQHNFTSRNFNVTNPIFADGNITEFSSNSAAGWEATTANNVVMGVVNTNVFDAFRGRQNIATLPFMSENPSSSHSGSPNVMVLANRSATGMSANFSQKLDTFWADGYFEVKVDFYAVGTGGNQGAIYLIPENEFTDGRPLPRVEANQVSLSSGNNGPDLRNMSIWQTATFLVKTDMLESVTFTLGLYLGGHGGQGGRGVVYYDNVRVTGYSAAQFASIFEQAQDDAINRRGKHHLTSVVDLSVPARPNPPNIMPYSYSIDRNGELVNVVEIFEDFDNRSPGTFRQIEFFPAPDNTNVRPFVRLLDAPAALNIQERNRPIFGITKPNNHGAMLMSAVSTRTSLRYQDTLTINRNEVYMINFYALSSDEVSSFVRIRDTRVGTLGIPPHIIPTLYNSGFMPIKFDTTPSSPSHNNWTLNTIFVVGDPFDDINVHFEFWIGGEENTTAFLMVDDFSVRRVSGQYFERHRSSSNVTETSVDWRSPTATIHNANFNNGTKRSNISAFPLVASGWEVNIEGEEVTNHFAERRIINGIVNTDTRHWAANNIVLPGGVSRAYGTAINPHEIWHNNQSINNNIYMMQNVTPTHQTVKSNSFTLASDTRNIISFDAATHNLSNREVWAVIEIGGREVSRLPLVRESGNITIRSEWRNYTIAVRTPQFSHPEARITFALGASTAPTTGTLFLDNVRVNQTATDVAFNNANTLVDLNDPSKLYMRRAGTGDRVGGESLFFVAEDPDTATAFFDAHFDVLNISTRGATHAIIHNTMTEQLQEEVAYEYTVRLSTNSNVRFSGFTDHSNCPPECRLTRTPGTADSCLNRTPEYGLSLRIKNFAEEERMDGGFINLTNEDLANLSSFGEIKLTFLIKSGTPLDLSLEIEFGNEDALVVGALGIRGLELKEISDDMFDARSAEENDWTRVITTSTREPEKEEEEREPGANLDFLLIPSLITGAAVIFAVVGFTVRRIRFRRHIGRHHTSYARDDFETKIPRKELKAPTAKKAPRKLRVSPEDKK